MNFSQALIVDDSKTAQHLLKRMLQKFNLKIDAVGSAEEALAYLSYNHPAVIFLDQQMTGMTGIQVLKTIKANPHTALIPVIMYTSQDDDLFVSQAIALGAQGIFSKSAMQPANLDRVLEGLNIRLIGDAVEDREAVTETAAAGSAAAPQIAAHAGVPRMGPPSALPSPPAGQAELDQVRAQIGRLFEIHIAETRNHINSSTQFVVKRMAANLDKNARRETIIGATSLNAFKSVVKNVMSTEHKKLVFGLNALLVMLILGMGFLAYQLFQVQGDLASNSKNVQAVLDAKLQEPAAVGAGGNQAAVEKKNAALLRAISWVQNADFQFNYGESPFNDIQLSHLNNLVYILAEGGYTGPVVVDVNFGNVCLEPAGPDNWRLARNDMPASACKMLKDLQPRFSGADYITDAYLSFEKSALAILDGRISLRLVSSGISVPRTDYPVIAATTTAGEWNRAALKNNRISIRLAN